MGTPVGGAPAGAGGGGIVLGASAPQWVHIFRIQTAGKIYELECSSKPCTLGNKEIALGDALTIRVDKKHAYLSSDSQGSPSPQEFKLLEESDVGASTEAKPH